MTLASMPASLLQKILRLWGQGAEETNPSAEDSWSTVSEFHGLTANESLTSEDYQKCVEIIKRVAALHAEWVLYVDSRGLDESVFFPNNEWADIINPRGPFRWRQDYNSINLLRLLCPFTGYWLLLMDRIDQFRKFPDDWSVEWAMKFIEDPVTEEALIAVHARFDPIDRVAHSIADFKDHALSVPQHLRFRAPKFFGEMGAICGDYVVNDDIVVVQARINAMFALGVIDKLHRDIRKNGFCRILEIGAGIGQQAAALKQIFGPSLQYIIIDLPPILVSSALYLSRLAGFQKSYILNDLDSWPDSFEFVFVANYLTERFRQSFGPVDLVVNTMSFGEMSESQIRYYGKLASDVVGVEGLLYEENCQVLSHHVSVLDILGESFRDRADLVSPKVLVRHGCHRVWGNQSQPEEVPELAG